MLETDVNETSLSPCLVIGASGFIGRNLVLKLAESGIAVRALTRSGEIKVEHPLVEWIKGDMLDIGTLDRVLENVGSVVQLGTTTKPASSNANIPFDISSNLIGNIRLLEKLAARKGVKFVFISSGGTVYGDPVYVPIKETHPTEPKSSYGITKLAIEKYIAMFSRLYDIDSTILRVSNPFGEYQSYSDGQGVVATFLWRALNDIPIEIWGDGSAVRDYLYVGDVCEAILAALHYRGKEPVFNIGYGKGLSVIEILKGIEETIGFSADVRFLPGRPTDVRVSVLDSSLAQREFGWSAKTSLYEGLQSTAQWMSTLLGREFARRVEEKRKKSS